MSRITMAIGGAFLAVFMLCIIGVIVGLDRQPIPAKQATTATNNTGPNPSQAAPANTSKKTTESDPDPAWNYSTENDPMGRGITKLASLDSVNEVEFQFPYNGGSTATIILRNSPVYGKDAMLEISKGQFDCGMDDCSVAFRADKGKITNVSANTAEDGSMDVIFLPYSTTVSYLKRAKIFRIEANFYQDGTRVFEFHPQGLNLKKMNR